MIDLPQILLPHEEDASSQYTTCQVSGNRSIKRAENQLKRTIYTSKGYLKMAREKQ